MKRLILTFFFLVGLIIVKIEGQSVDKSALVLGDWCACGLKIQCR